MMWRAISRLVSGRSGPGGDLTVLFFHRVLPQHDAMLGDEPVAEAFARVLQWLNSQYTLLPLDEAVQRMQNGSLPRAAAAVTFDDGYHDNFAVAAPLLRSAGVPATFFISTGFLDGGIMWNDRVTEAVRLSAADHIDSGSLGLGPLALGGLAARGQVAGQILLALKYLGPDERDAAVNQVVAACGCSLPTDLMMSSEQVRSLSQQGFGIGAHTVTHPILASLGDAQARQEITQSRATLETLLGRKVGLFAFPNGRMGKDFDARHAAMAREAGYEAAFTTEPGVCTKLSDPWSLPRFTPWDRTELRFRLRLLSNQRTRSAGIRPPSAEASATER